MEVLKEKKRERKKERKKARLGLWKERKRRGKQRKKKKLELYRLKTNSFFLLKFHIKSNKRIYVPFLAWCDLERKLEKISNLLLNDENLLFVAFMIFW